jgi:RNase P/RNase MRP subunit p29
MKTQVGKDGSVVVSKVENNTVYVNAGDKKDVEIPKDRYVKQVGKPEGAKPEI